MKKLIILLMLVSSSCDSKRPHWENICIKQHIQMIMLPTIIGKTTILRPHPVIYCDKRQKTCIIPENWEGDHVCPPIHESELDQ